MSIIDHEIKDNNDKTKHNTLICLTMDVLCYNKTPQINSDSVNCLLSTWAYWTTWKSVRSSLYWDMESMSCAISSSSWSLYYDHIRCITSVNFLNLMWN